MRGCVSVCIHTQQHLYVHKGTNSRTGTGHLSQYNVQHWGLVANLEEGVFVSTVDTRVRPEVAPVRRSG